MNIIKNLSNWKTWIFVIFPFLMLLTYLGIMIYGAVVKSVNVSLIVLSQILFTMAVVLFFCDNILKLIRRKAVWRVVVSSLFVFCFLGFRILYTAKLTECLEVSIEYETLKEEWEAIPYENRDKFWDKFDDLQQVGNLRNEIYCRLSAFGKSWRFNCCGLL